MAWFKKSRPPKTPKEPRGGIFSTHETDNGTDDIIRTRARTRWSAMQDRLNASIPAMNLVTSDGFAMDADDGMDQNSIKAAYQLDTPTVSEALLLWYAAQTFIGAQMCAILSQHWLIDKACSMPARDAMRHGYKVVTDDEGELPAPVLASIKKYDKQFKIQKQIEQYLRKGRIFGVRVAYFKVVSKDPLYYEKPFNIDGVLPNSYKGIVQLDPYWLSPMLSGEDSSDPTSLSFYEPTWWMIKGQKYHRSHLMIFRNSEVPDILKPSYIYGGVPVPQQIMERVYAAERTANEGPLLAMTKRTTVLKTNVAKAFANMEKFNERLMEWCGLRDNFQVKVIDKEEDELEIKDIALADLDVVIMTQYQLVAAAARVPATKLLGTTPKGFNSTGDYEESSYHEELETLQTHDAQPFLERHHALVMRSYIVPKFGVAPIELTIEWPPMDSPTALEQAQTNLNKAQTGVALASIGAIDGADEANRLINDPDSGYTHISVPLMATGASEHDNDQDGPDGEDENSDGDADGKSDAPPAKPGSNAKDGAQGNAGAK